MNRNILIGFALCLMSGCVHESAIPLGNDMAEVDVSAASVYGRAGVERIALENAAKITLKMGYDKFIVVKNSDWNESTLSAGSYNQATVNPYGGQASGGSQISTRRNPESKMLIHMFHNGDKGSAKAIDANKILEMNSNQQ